MNDVLQAAVKEYVRTDLPQFRAGDRVAVDGKVVEGTRSRGQTFEGDVIAL